MKYGKIGEDHVTRLIEHCHRNRTAAEHLFADLIANRQSRVQVDGVEIILSEEELGEFAARFSAEVEPTLWESKRRKDQV